jgi:hypothetical protein
MKGRLLAFISGRGVGGPAPPLLLMFKFAGGDVGGAVALQWYGEGGRELSEVERDSAAALWVVGELG